MKEIYKKENLEIAVSKSTSIRSTAINLGMCSTGGNFYTIRKYINLHKIDTSHFLTRDEVLNNLHFANKIPDEYVFIINSKYSNSTNLKDRAIKAGIVNYECYTCKNNGVWQNKPLTLQLDHINGVNDDNRPENLRILCPNCHTQTDTYSGKHKGKAFMKAQERLKNEGKTIKEIQSSIDRRLVERPSAEKLSKLIKEFGFKGVGKIYNVSDNTIRKWCVNYGMSKYKKDYK